MKNVSDYIKTLVSEDGGDGNPGATNTVSSGAVALRELPFSKMAKRKSLEKESLAYDAPNPLADAAGKIALASVYAPEQEPDDDPHLFHQKQQYQNDQVMSA